MLDMKHFVIENKLDEPFRYFKRIKCFANRNSLVDAIMVAQNIASAALGPGESGLRYLPVKIATVKLREHLIQVISFSVCR